MELVDPHQGKNNIMPFLFLPLRLTCNTYIVKSNLRSKESLVIQSNQNVHVCGYMVDIYGG
jgi:hypothetical protein